MTGLLFRLAALFLCAATAGTPAAGSGLLAQGITAHGGWGIFSPATDHMPAAERARIQDRIRTNIAHIAAEGRLDVALKATAPLFSWPVRIAEGVPGVTTYGITNFVDQDPAVGSFRDFHCGIRTYDLAGGGHRGTDIAPIFGWRKFENEEAVVVAAAPGIIVLKQDGNQDRTCEIVSVLLPNAAQWNAVSLRHVDGSVTWYGHLKKNSLTPKGVGDTVAVGEYLGAVGSSGFSSGPHLHFEVYDAANNLIDPWQGSCNQTIGASWWKDQPPYEDPQIVLLMPSKSVPSISNLVPPCDATTHTAAVVPASFYFQSDYYFPPGANAFFVAFLRDALPGAAIGFTLRRPDGTVFTSNPQNWDQPYANSVFVYLSVLLPITAPAGQWNMEVTFGGQTQSMPIFVGAANLAASTVTVFDFYNTDLDHFFRTANPAEALAVDAGQAGPGWQRTGDDFQALTRAATGYGASAVCRFFGSAPPGPGPNSHFYTGVTFECNGLLQLQQTTPASQPRWNFEEIAFSILLPVNGVCPQQAPVPVYRLYNNGFARNDSNHRYTTKSSAYYQQMALGWSREGPMMCANGRP